MRLVLPFTLSLVLSSGIALASMSGTAAPSPGVEPAPPDTVRLRPSAASRARVRDLEAWLAANPGTRSHVATDRPLYRPGDTIRVRAWNVATRSLTPSGATAALELVDPRGSVVARAAAALQSGAAEGTFTLDPKAPGGSWIVRASFGGVVTERAIDVNTFEIPRIKKALVFARDGYRPGDTVRAAITLDRATGEHLSGAALTANVRIGGQVLDPIRTTANARGEATVSFVLPADLVDPDVLLTVLVDDAGVTESISRAVPVALADVDVRMFPEGGDLVAGLESRVYFEATDRHGDPVYVHGDVLDERGNVVTTMATAADGRGSFAMVPVSGHAYRLRDAATGREFPLPEARGNGCVMRHFDDLEGAQTAVRVRVACSAPRDVTVVAVQHEQVLDRATFHVDHETTVHLRSGDTALASEPGVARVTVLDADQEPLAERLVYRNKGKGLRMSVQADRERYAPGDEVTLTVRARDARGTPVAAHLGVDVVDDALLALADSHASSLASDLLLQADLPEPIEGAAAWFRPDAEDGGRAIDLALGTRGWRRFDWSQVVGFYEAQQTQQRWELEGVATGIARLAGGVVLYDDEDRMFREVPAMSMPAEEAPVPTTVAVDKAVAMPTGAPERQFAPALPRRAPRSDFRDTVYWGAVDTGPDGDATVRFRLDDAITTFRASVEGLGGGRVGLGEAMLASVLPLHVEARIPAALSTGDHLDLPVTVESQRAASVGLTAHVGDLLHLGRAPEALSLTAGERRTVWLSLDAKPGQGAAEIALDARAGDLSDALVRSIPVVPRGVPRAWTASGRLAGKASHTVVVPTEALEGSISGSVTLLPTPVSEVLAGIEQMVRTPGGCFEQTSSTNWPNVVVIDLLERSGESGRLGVDRAQVLSTGYGILQKYQVGSGGFETWGDGPGKEALTAFGLLEFTDMARVQAIDPAILHESAKYLLDQRDGKGGYAVTGASAHGYGTAPPEVLDAYITYALVETGHVDLPRELDKSAELARRSRDPYRMGLATLALLKTRPADGKAAAARLASLQAADGGFPGSETSITRSENQNLDVEATALAAMALSRAGEHERARRALGWLHDHQVGPGQWGATQGNALALRAIGEVAAVGSTGDAPMTLVVSVDGETVARQSIPAGTNDPVSVDIGHFLSMGSHTVSLALDGRTVPYVVQAGWTAELPASDPTRRVDLTTHLADQRVALGHTTQLTATLTNRTSEVVPDPIARIGLPAGLEARPDQLEQMKKRGEIAAFELRPREVTVYWDGIAAGEVHTVALDLVAAAAGRFTAPASSAYPYYDDQARAWVPGGTVEVVR